MTYVYPDEFCHLLILVYSLKNNSNERSEFIPMKIKNEYLSLGI
jgi:hypothetical protein